MLINCPLMLSDSPASQISNASRCDWRIVKTDSLDHSQLPQFSCSMRAARLHRNGPIYAFRAKTDMLR